MKKLRVLHVVVQPVVVWDDGEELQPGPQVQAVAVTPAALAEYVDQLPGKIAEFSNQLLASEAETPAPASNRATRRQRAKPAVKRVGKTAG